MENNNEMELPCWFLPVCLWVRLVFMIFSFIKTMFCWPFVVSKHATGGPCQAPMYAETNELLLFPPKYDRK